MPYTQKSSQSLELHAKTLINAQILELFSPNNPHPGYFCRAWYSVVLRVGDGDTD